MAMLEEKKPEWHFAAFGLNTSQDEADNGYRCNEDGSVTVWSLNNHGKLNLPSTDGIAFYYTVLPSDKYFSLTARVRIDEWTFTNGQEGFGLLAADRIGVHGVEGSFWNNSYMAACARVEYRQDPETGAIVTNSIYPLVSMKLGIGAQEKTGITPENLPAFEAGSLDTLKKSYISRMVPLESSCAEKGQGSYNLFDHETSGRVIGTVEQPLQEVILRICRNATGYELSYLDEDGTVIGIRQFTNPDALSILDPTHIYIGFFAARFCRATFRDVTLEIRDAAGKTAEPLLQYAVPTCRILSSSVSNHAVYTLKFVTNVDGTVTLRSPDNQCFLLPARAREPEIQHLLLVSGENRLELSFNPKKDGLIRDEAETMRVVDRVLKRTFTVVYEPPGGNILTGKTLYVAPSGTEDGLGTAESPLDIETAIRHVIPGDEILLEGGLYRPGKKILVERDMNGLPRKPIRMAAQPGTRAVFDFEKKSAGFVFAGNYWKIEGIDCLNSADFTPGIQLSGHDIHLNRACACGNGDGGIVIWTLLDTDSRNDWPHDIQVTSCIACNNADPGATNADGFAAKLTVGPGIVFDSCISCFNADDGWDLFTKVELGTTSPVVIKNCIAFCNGYDPSGQRRGYGNGFKLGGTSLPGGHFLYNCAAWKNAGKGIDSNSAPDGQIKACTSFDNDGANVALFTSDAKNTDYSVYGLVSCRSGSSGPDDILMPRGTQDLSKIHGPDCFYWNQGQSVNAAGLQFKQSWFASLLAPESGPDSLPGDLMQCMDENGAIQLGKFLMLTEAATAELQAHDVNPHNAVAHLEGKMHLKDEEGPEQFMNGPDPAKKTDGTDKSGKMDKTVIVNSLNDIEQAKGLISGHLRHGDVRTCLLLSETMLTHFLYSGLTHIQVRVKGHHKQWVEIQASGEEIDFVIPKGVSENVREEMEIGLKIIERYLYMLELHYLKGVNRCRIYTETLEELDLGHEIDAFYQNADEKDRGKPLAVLGYLVRNHKKRFALSMLYKTIRHIGAMLLPIFAANILDSVVNGNPFFSIRNWLNIIGSVLALSANLIGFWAENRTYRRFTRAVQSGFKMALVKKLQLLSMKYHSSVQSGTLLSKLISDVQFVEMLIYDRLQDVLHLVIDIIILIITALLRFPPMLIFYAVIIPAQFLIVRRFTKPILTRKVIMRRKTENVNAAFREMLGMNQLTRMHGAQKATYQKIAGKVRREQLASNDFDDMNVSVNNVTFGGFQGFRILCLCFAAFLCTRGYISVGTIILFQSLFDMMVNSVQKVLDAVPQIVQGYDSLVSINEILFANDIEHNGTKKLPEPVRGEIELKHVTFMYDPQAEPVLDDVSLKIPAGSIVAFIGRSGMGKSTLLNLILGLHACTGGEILIDGINLNELDKNDFRHHVAVVPQNTVLFSGTLWDNLVYGSSYVSRDQVMDVIRRVGLEDLIESLPDGLDSTILEDGSNLSGGQRQRIAIARAMLRNAKFILFDEATSALDSESEQIVQKAIDAMTASSTVIMVAHRLNTLKKANLIYRIENGKAVLCPSLDDLIHESQELLTDHDI